MLRSGLISVAVFALCGMASAEEWTQFRGPHGDGHSTATGLPTTWSDTENVAWRIEIPGKAWSSPVCYKDHLYLTTAVPVDKPENGQSLRTICYEIRSGKEVWNHEIFLMDGKRSATIHPKNSFASPTPLISGQHIFVHFGTHGTACLNLDGTVVWKNEELIYPHSHGSGGSLVLAGNHLVVSCDGSSDPFVVGLDATTGKIAWKTPRSVPDAPRKFAFCTALALPLNGTTQVISPGGGAVISYDAATGKEIWKCKYGEGYSVIPYPVYGHGLVYVCSGYNKPSLFAIKPDGTGDVSDSKIAWTTDKGVPHSASLLLVDKILYMISDAGVATALDAETGDSLWTHRIGGNFSSSPVYVDGNIFVIDEAGLTTVFKPGRTYEEVAQNPLNDKTQASFAIADGAFFIRTEKYLFRIQAN